MGNRLLGKMTVMMVCICLLTGAAGEFSVPAALAADEETSSPDGSGHTHTYGSWKTEKAATALEEGRQRRVCSICGYTEYQVVAKLNPTAKLNMTTIKLKKKQATSALEVSGLAAGDYVAGYRSGNKKIFKVSSSGKITAKNKLGSAKLYVVLASGKEVTAKVKVQKSTVKTAGLSVNTSTLTLLKGGSYTLKATRSPLTSKQKITYSSSNKKVATVDSKGQVKAKKKGKCKIYVKSGSKKKTVSVNVIAKNFQLGDTTAFLQSCAKITNIIITDGNWIYSNSGLLKNFNDARNAPVRKTSCAHYVCMCLQDFGIFDANMTFYSDSKAAIKYEGSSAQKKATEERLLAVFDIIDLGEGIVAKEANLQPGDICLYKEHTNIFSYYDSDGNPWWYDGGRNSTSDGKVESGVFTNMYRACTYSTKPVKKILRMKATLNP